MHRLRLLVWLFALAAFACPVVIVTASPTHAAMTDCPHKDTAKHAAGTCCPLMAAAVALLPATIAPTPAVAVVRIVSPSRRLDGVSYVKDPPPPRV